MKHDFFKDEEKIDNYEKENGLGKYATPTAPAKEEKNTEVEEKQEEQEETEENTEVEEPAGTEEPAETEESEEE